MSITEKLLALKNAKAAENLAQGEAFLAENAKKEGVTALESGLQYEVLSSGTGKQHPEATDKVSCHYHGTLIDGRVFDSSVRRGQPATFPLNRVIKGWTEALQLMVVGDKWRLFLPAHLAYGDAHVSAEIGPNSTLIFEVELLGIS
jgi:FKBP-type peptidyl-prolyl cis-trans isomerase FklB